jgi:hypothetical protein
VAAQELVIVTGFEKFTEGKEMAQQKLERMSLDIDDGVAVLKFNHPEVMNAVGAQMLRDFSAALGEINNPQNGARAVNAQAVRVMGCAPATTRS